jgi:hypothetical protein
MKKKKIELNQKLFLNKEKVASLGNIDQVLGGGRFTADENCIRPVDNGSVQQVAVSKDWIGGCAVAASLAMNACQASGLPVCYGAISQVGGVCASNPGEGC